MIAGRFALLGVAAAAAAIIACSAGPARPASTGGATTTAVVSDPGGAVAGRLATRTVRVCFAGAPAGWAGTTRATLPRDMFTAMAVAPDGTRAYGELRTAAGADQVVSIDLSSGAVTRVVTLPATASGIFSLAADPAWLAWVQGDSAYAVGAWTLRAHNLATGEDLTIASSRQPDGSELFGYAPQVSLADGVLTWAQPTSTSGPIATADVRALDLATHQQATLDSGPVGSPVRAGRLLVWSRTGTDGRTSLRAVDARTRQPVPLPAQVRDQASAVSLTGSPTALAWSTDALHAIVWSIDRGQLTTYTLSDSSNRFQFLSLAGRFLTWYTGSPTAVMDLDTGGAFDTPAHGLIYGTVAGSDRTIVRSEPLADGGKVGVVGTAVSSLATATAPAIAGCAR